MKVTVEESPCVVVVSSEGPQGPIGPAGASGVVTLGTTFPVDPEAGQMFYNTDTATLSIWQGIDWVEVGQGVVTYRLLTENSFRLITEDSNQLIQE